MMEPQKWILVMILLQMMLCNTSFAQTYRCSQSQEQCVFPFEHEGEMHNECVTGRFGYYWCNTDGPYGWAYCEVCPDEPSTTTSISTVSSSASTTSAATTTQSTRTTTTSPPSTTSPPTTTTTSTMTTTTTTPGTPTTTSTPVTPIKAAETSIRTHNTTTVSRKTVSQKSTMPLAKLEATSTQLKQDEGTTSLEDTEPEISSEATNPADHSTNQVSSTPTPIERNKTSQAEPPGGNSNKADSASDEESRTMTAASTKTPTIVRRCTTSGIDCHFPFEYRGETYYTCVGSFLTTWGWCYTDVAINEYSDCIPCEESSTTTTTTTTSKFPTFSSIEPESPAIQAGGRIPESSTAPTGLDPITTTQEQATEPDPEAGNSDQDQDEDDQGTGMITIVVLVLGLLAFIVILAMVFLYVRKLRNTKEEETRENGNVCESGKELLSQNKNGNHKPVNDGNSQEMEPLNSKPAKDDRAGGDCAVINEKDVISENGVTASVTV